MCINRWVDRLNWTHISHALASIINISPLYVQISTWRMTDIKYQLNPTTSTNHYRKNRFFSFFVMRINQINFNLPFHLLLNCLCSRKVQRFYFSYCHRSHQIHILANTRYLLEFRMNKNAMSTNHFKYNCQVFKYSRNILAKKIFFSNLCSCIGITLIAWVTVQFTTRLTWFSSGRSPITY